MVGSIMNTVVLTFGGILSSRKDQKRNLMYFTSFHQNFKQEWAAEFKLMLKGSDKKDKLLEITKIIVILQ